MKKHGGLSYLEWCAMTPFWRLDFVRRLNKDLKEEGEGRKGLFGQIQNMLKQIVGR